MENRHEICITLDKLMIEMLGLLEEKVQSQINVENGIKNGSIHLAKSRYIMGQNSISKVQLPTENTPEFDATIKIENKEVEEAEVKFQKCLFIDTETQTNPIKWFGVLVPQNLHQAQNIFKKTAEYVIESINIDKKLSAIYCEIDKMKSLKLKFTPEE